MSDKKSSHLGAGLAAGAAIGLALGMFLQSKQGKAIRKDAMKKAVAMQKQIAKKLEEGGELTKEKYEEVVEKAIAYYAKTKEIAKAEIPEVRKFLQGQWKEISSKLK
jgi:gas vesicle protein